MDREDKELYIGRVNVVLEKHGIITNYLWTTEEEKNIFLRDISNYSRDRKYSLLSTRRMSEDLGISEERYLDLIQEHLKAQDIKKIKEDDNINRADRVRINNIRLRAVYERIIKIQDITIEDNLKEIDNIITESGYNISHLYENFSLYKKFYTKEEADKFYSNYKEYRKYRLKYQKEKRIELQKEKENERLREVLEKANEVISSYLKTTGITFEQFLLNNNISSEDFNDYIKSIEVNNSDLYNEYLSKKEEKEKEYQDALNNQIKELGYRLVNGYDIDGKKRNFDILDYFEITCIPLSNIFQVASKILNRHELYLLKKLRSNYINSDKYSASEEKTIMEEKRIIGTKFDKFGRIIEGSGREITLDEKNKIINYLNNKGIPVNRLTYNTALKRYLDGFISFDSKSLLLKINS